MNGGQFPGEWDFGFTKPTGAHKGHNQGFDIDVGNTTKFSVSRSTSCMSQKKQARFLLKVVHDCRLSNIEVIYANDGTFIPDDDHPEVESGLLDFWNEIQSSNCPNRTKIYPESGHSSYFHVKFHDPLKVSPDDPISCVDACSVCPQACIPVVENDCPVSP